MVAPLVPIGIKILGEIGIAAAGSAIAQAMSRSNGILKPPSITPHNLSLILKETQNFSPSAIPAATSAVVALSNNLGGKKGLIDTIIELVKDFGLEVVSSFLGAWALDLITEDESQQEKAQDSESCATALEDINNQAGSNIDAAGEKLHTEVQRCCAIMDTIDKTEHPEAYAQCEAVLNDLLNSGMQCMRDELRDRNETLKNCADQYATQIECECEREFNFPLPGPAGTPQTPAPAPAAAGSVVTEAASAMPSTPVSTTPVMEAASSHFTAAPPAHTNGLGAQLGAQIGAHLGARIEAHITGEFSGSLSSAAGIATQQVSLTPPPAQMQGVMNGCTTMATSSCGVVGHASVNAAATLLAAVGEEVHKHVHNFVSDASNAINAFRAQAEAHLNAALDACATTTVEPACEPVAPAPEPAPTPEDGFDKEHLKDTPPTETTPAPTPTPEEGFDKSALKPDAPTEGFDKTALKPDASEGFDKTNLAPEAAEGDAPTMAASTSSAGLAWSSSIHAEGEMRKVGQW